MRTKEQILEDFRDIECALSPENLHCDGEISVASARKKERALLAKRKKLVEEYGSEPTLQELFPELLR